MSWGNGLAAANKANAQKAKILSMVNGFGIRGGTQRRGNGAVRRGSQYAGQAEWTKWGECNVKSRIEKETILDIVFKWADDGKQKGRAWGFLTPKDKDVYTMLWNSRCFTTGKLDYAYSHMKIMAGCCIGTLSKAFKKFEEHGLLERLRRSVPIDDPEPGGPRVAQITTAYFLKLPRFIQRQVDAALKKVAAVVLPPVPPPRAPTPHERAALAEATSPSQGLSKAGSARRGYYRNSMISRLNACANAGAFINEGDSSP